LTSDLKKLSNTSAPPLSGKNSAPGVITGPASAAVPAAQHNKHDELRLLVNSRHPIITAETAEEERLEQMLLEVATELSVPLFEWTVTAGLAKFGGAEIYNTEPPEQKWPQSANGRRPAPHLRIKSAPPHGAAYQYRIATT